MPTAVSSRLFVSFWAICLDNLPPGTFGHRLISADDAKRRIAQAREHNTLLCLSDDDLLATYHQHERDNHEALCRVLQQDWSINLSFKDFCSTCGDDASPLYTINPLNCVQVQGQDCLLIVTCHYSLDENSENPLRSLQVASNSVGFHLIEALHTNHTDKPPSAGAASPDPLLGSMREDAELLNQIVANAMRQRQIRAWHPREEDFTALEAIADVTGQTVQEVLNDAVRHFLANR